MYLLRGDGGFDLVSLRQGDILEGVPFPLLDHTKISVLGNIEQEHPYNTLPTISARKHQHRNDPEWVTALVPMRFGYCAVLSNCCDLEPRGGRVQTPVVTVARLHPIPNDIRNDADAFTSLTSNKDPRDPNDPGYIDYFYLREHTLIGGRDWRVHYNQVATLPTTDMPLLLGKKILQLDDRTRVKFKIKLGFTLMRMNDEELAAGLENPWDHP